MGAGLESVPLPRPDVSPDWPIDNHYRRGSVLPNANDVRYLQVCAAPFSSDAAFLATNLRGRLVYDYGKYHLSDRAPPRTDGERERLPLRIISEFYLQWHVLTERLRNIHTTGDDP